MQYLKLTATAGALALSSAIALAQTAPANDPARSTVAVEPTMPAENQAAAMTKAGSDLATSQLVGATVYNTANEKIGEIDDIIIAQSGSVSAVVVGVGGFLGVGEKKIAMPYASLKTERGDNNALKVVIDGTKESLKAMPEFKVSS